MGNDWDIPKWRKEGRTGPGPIAPRYAKQKDRRAVKMGREVGGGRRKIPHNIPQGKTSHQKGGKGNGCAVVAIAALGGAAGLVWGLTEAVRSVL